MADGRDLLLGPGGLAGFTVHLEREPNPGTRRLMDWLGVTVEVRPVSDSPVDHVRRAGTRGRTMGHYEPGYESPVAETGKPDWIDYRASVGRAERRLEAGELVSRCWSCKTELDVPAPVHSPRCRRNGTDGREALDAMDSLVTQAELLDDQADDEEDVDVEAEPEPESEEEVETVRAPQRAWTREQIIQAIRTWAIEHGKPPASKEWDQASTDHPAKSTVAKHCGSWADAVAAAGFDRPTRGGNQRSSVREPKAREAGGLVSPPPAAVKQPALTGDAAVSRESPGPVAAEAGSPTDEHGNENRNNSAPVLGLEDHAEWYANLPPEIGELQDEIARLDLLAGVSALQRDALQAFLDALAAE